MKIETPKKMRSVFDEVRDLQDGLRLAERLIQDILNDIAAIPSRREILSESTWDTLQRYQAYKVKNPEVYCG